MNLLTETNWTQLSWSLMSHLGPKQIIPVFWLTFYDQRPAPFTSNPCSTQTGGVGGGICRWAASTSLEIWGRCMPFWRLAARPCSLIDPIVVCTNAFVNVLLVYNCFHFGESLQLPVCGRGWPKHALAMDEMLSDSVPTSKWQSVVGWIILDPCPSNMIKHRWLRNVRKPQVNEHLQYMGR